MDKQKELDHYTTKFAMHSERVRRLEKLRETDRSSSAKKRLVDEKKLKLHAKERIEQLTKEQNGTSYIIL